MTEACMIRKMGEMYDGKFEFIVGSTDTVNSSNFIEQIYPCLVNRKPLYDQ
jgi:hypothetical protein